MHKEKSRIARYILLVVLVVAWVLQYNSINTYFAKLDTTSREYYERGIKVPFGDNYQNLGVCAEGYALRVDEFEVVDYDSYIQSKFPNAEPSTTNPERLAIVKVTLFNDNSTEQGVLLSEIILHGIDIYCGLNRQLLDLCNPILEGNLGINLPQGTHCELVLVYNLFEEYFERAVWTNFAEYDLWLRITAFPTENCIQVQ